MCRFNRFNSAIDRFHFRSLLNRRRNTSPVILDLTVKSSQNRPDFLRIAKHFHMEIPPFRLPLKKPPKSDGFLKGKQGRETAP
jgi:hypothetical protein